MKQFTRVIIGLTTLMFLSSAMPIVTPMGNEAEAGGLKKFFQNHTSNNELKDLILMLKEQIDNLPSGGSGGDEGNHTLRWDKVLDSTNGNDFTPGAFGCNSDRFKCIMPTTAFPAGEAVLDLQTGLVWDRAPHDTRNETGLNADDPQIWTNARFQCALRVMGARRASDCHRLRSWRA